MANRTHLTAPRIERLSTEKAQDFLWDDDPDCLGVRVTKNGAKSFVFEKKLHGKTVRKTIGSVNDWKIPTARIEARELAMMVDKGIDPRKVAAEQRIKAREEAAKSAAMKQPAREAWNAYLAANKSKWSTAHHQGHLNVSQEGGTKPKRGKALLKPGPLNPLLQLPLQNITAEAVKGWMETEKKTRPTVAGNCFRMFRAFINWCSQHNQYRHAVNTDCCNSRSVKEAAPKGKTKPSDLLQREQLALWFEHVRKLSNPCFSAYLQALLLTGTRRSEMLQLKWSDLDFDWKKFRVYDTENDAGYREIPLTPYLASTLEALPRIEDNEWVFSSPTSKEGHIIGAPKAHTDMLKKAGLPHVSLHGLRRSFATLSHWVGIPAGVPEQIMGHKPKTTAERHYIFLPIDLLRSHHERIEAWMLKEAGIEFNEQSAD